MAQKINDGNLEAFLKTDKLVILKFGAQWCSPCRMIEPIIKELAEEHTDIEIGSVDIDNNPEASTKYGIRSIPAIYFIKNGEVLDKIIGAVPKVDLVKKIEAHK
jgi:thioredoxin 1